ncbi:hypothetical protein [Amycolatopsis sp. PS_44_ISF1]|uniref:hypothetical protein n=1 Tax=Amycolatopsis sp. PS_44_ISF1 TaxID=2974917 RepID=UPI0028DEC774|nr:hypothetical protein [Amycolatopsis sp. PS_44_ISF1]MDT8910231.1 hypothetical protein [Amycolatopsis sp. PS_44_ISF1]
MLRTADRRATPPADPAATDLLDRTGIIAASLPRGRRGPEDPDLEDTQPIPVVPGGVALRPGPGGAAAGAAGAALAGEALIDSRPRAVVIRRRRRAWAGGSAALALVALGWLAGGLFGGSLVAGSSDDAVAQTDQRPVVAPQVAPQPAPSAPVTTPEADPAAAPVTVYVPAPTSSKPVKHNPVKPPPTHRSTSDDAATERADTGRADTKPAPPSSSPNVVQRYLDRWTGLVSRVAGGR